MLLYLMDISSSVCSHSKVVSLLVFKIHPLFFFSYMENFTSIEFIKSGTSLIIFHQYFKIWVFSFFLSFFLFFFLLAFIIDTPRLWARILHFPSFRIPRRKYKILFQENVLFVQINEQSLTSEENKWNSVEWIFDLIFEMHRT